MRSSVKFDGGQAKVDPQLLFLRLITASSTLPVFADVIWDLLGSDVSADISKDGKQYVLDGGALVQHILSSRGSTHRATSTISMYEEVRISHSRICQI